MQLTIAVQVDYKIAVTLRFTIPMANKPRRYTEKYDYFILNFITKNGATSFNS
jgi:hypothetical protein